MPTRPFIRRLLSCLPALLLATLAALIAHLMIPTYYESRGLIEIKPYLKIISLLSDPKDADYLTLFDAYVSDQVSLIKSSDCQKGAMESVAWKSAITRTSCPRTPAQFARRLSVDRNGTLILVRFFDENPFVAQAAVQTLIACYKATVSQIDAKDEEDRQALTLQIQAAKMAPAYTEMQPAAVNAVATLDAKLEELNLRLYGGGRVNVLEDGDLPLHLMPNHRIWIIVLTAAVGSLVGLAVDQVLQHFTRKVNQPRREPPMFPNPSPPSFWLP